MARRARAIMLVFSLVLAACGGTPADSDSPSTTQDLDTQTSAPTVTSVDELTETTNQESDAENTEVSFRLDFLIQAYHAPFFLALERGFFDEEGLEVSINDGEGSGTAITLVATGQEEFGFASLATMTLAAVNEDVPIMAVAGLIQRDASSAIFLTDSEIEQPQDLEGTTWAATPGSSTEALFPAFADQVGIDVSTINVVSVDAGVKSTSVINGDADFFTSFAATQLPVFAEQGVDLRAFTYADYGVSVLGHGIVVNPEYATANPEVVRGFLSAVIRGELASIEDPESAVDALISNRPEQTDLRDVYIQQLEGFNELLHTEATADQPVGVMDAGDWASTVAILEQYLELESGANSDTLYTNEYLPDS